MKVNIWVAVIVLTAGSWDLYYAYNRYQEEKVTKGGSKADAISFAILGAIFTIGRIIMLFMHQDQVVRNLVKLVLVRRRESITNRDNVYTGWNDVPLSKKGVEQAKDAGPKAAKTPDSVPTHIRTPVLSRVIMTANIIADVCSFLYLPITKTWRLNEKHYGALRGISKDVSKKIFGKEQMLKWRRGFDSVSPLLTQPVQGHGCQKYDMRLILQGESLHQTQGRLMPYFWDHTMPGLMFGYDQLIVAHGSSLRALIKKTEGISNKDTAKAEVPNAGPIVHTFDSDLHITKKGTLH